MKTLRFILLTTLAILVVATITGCGATGAPSDQGTTDSSSTTGDSSDSSSSDTNGGSETNTGDEPGASYPSVDACTGEVCNLSGSFVLRQPVSTGNKNVIDYTSRFGSYRASNDTANRGVYFLISTGTPVLAAADGTVVVAGDDSTTSYGRAAKVYGNLVILKHQIPGLSEPVFTLYGHLSEVGVAVDDTVNAGDEIGKVGNSGSISGSALVFEVRVGNNDIFSLSNPELWLEPIARNTGAIAGRVLDKSGNYVTIDNIVVERLGEQGQPALAQFYLQTYTRSDLIGLPPFEDSFAIGELPAGRYQLTFYLLKFYQMEVEVTAGEITYVTFTTE